MQNVLSIAYQSVFAKSTAVTQVMSHVRTTFNPFAGKAAAGDLCIKSDDQSSLGLVAVAAQCNHPR